MNEVIQENGIYYELKEKINDLNINDTLKKGLNNLNERISKIKKYDLDFDMNIIINNCSKSNIETLLENISYIIEAHGVCKEVVKYSELRDMKKNMHLKTILILDDYDALQNEKELDGYQYYKFRKHVLKNNTNLIIPCEGNFQDIYKDIFEDEIENIINNSIFLNDEEMSNYEIITKLLEMYSRNKIECDISKFELSDIVSYFLKEKYCYNSNCIEHLYKESIKSMLLKNENRININCFEEYVNRDKQEQEKERESNKLDDLVGLDNVKKEIELLKNYLEFQNKSKGQFDTTYLNMFFMGDPGTGKTTVARAIADILYELGYLKNNNVVEIIPTDLMANYVGQTKDKTREILRKAAGGILFIDEAYLICQVKSRQGHTSFMGEAVVELIKYLEDPKNVVIFAGYPDEMKKIYECNPGIKSRIYKEIYFDNYSSNELYFILEKDLKKMGLKISASAKNKILNLLNKARHNKGFGNARFCKQYAQKLVINHANKRLKRENFTISLDDVSDIEESNKTRMGFVGDSNV